jgi:hypothetical protein
MTRARKPDPSTAMRLLIEQVRAAMPFDVPRARLCDGRCDGCSQKLLDWLEQELDGWQARLAAGEQPRLGDVDRLARSSRKVHAVLVRNGLVVPAES